MMGLLAFFSEKFHIVVKNKLDGKRINNGHKYEKRNHFVQVQVIACHSIFEKTVIEGRW